MRNNKLKGFSLTEILISLVIVSIMTAIAVPVITLRPFSFSGIDKTVQNCILKDNGNNSTANCIAAISACKYNKGNACTTLMSYSDSSSNTTQATNSLKILREVCDNGGTDACNFFVNKCVGDNATCNLTGADNKYYDFRYYLDLDYNSSNQGFLYLLKNAKNYFKKGVTNVVSAFDRAVVSASNESTAGYYFVNQLCNDTGDNNACNIINNSCLKLKDGNSSACITACTNNTDINSYVCQLVENACTSNKLITTASCAAINENPDIFKKYIVENCNSSMTEFCTTAYNNNLNKSCNQIKTTLDSDAVDKTYYITPTGTPIQAQCNMSGFDDYKDVHHDGGWTLVLNYLHQGGTNLALNTTSSSLPLQNSTDINNPPNEVGSQYWGHASNSLMNSLNFSNVRFYCKTSHTGIANDTFNPSNVINFQTNACNDYFKTGSGYCNVSIKNDYTGVNNETNTPSASYPSYIVNRATNNQNLAMTKIPFIYSYRDTKNNTHNYNYEYYEYNYNTPNSSTYCYNYDNYYRNSYNYNYNYYNDPYTYNSYDNYNNSYHYDANSYYLNDSNDKAHAWNIGPINSDNLINLWACDDYPNNSSNYNTFHQIWVK